MNERVKELRKILGLTQVEFAKKIAIVQSGYSQIESGTRGVNPRTIALICERFGVCEEWLKEGVGEIFEKQSNKSKERPEIYDLLTTYSKLKPEYQQYLRLQIDNLLNLQNKSVADELVVITNGKYEKPKPTIYSDDYDNLSTEDKKRALCEAVDKEENAKKAAAKYAV